MGLVLYDHDNTVLFGSGCALLYLYFLDWKLNLICEQSAEDLVNLLSDCLHHCDKAGNRFV